MTEAIQITDVSFVREVLEFNNTVLVDFWAPWCGPCRMVSIVIDEIAKDYGSKLKILNTNLTLNIKIEICLRISHWNNVYKMKTNLKISTYIMHILNIVKSNLVKKTIKQKKYLDM
uniref:thioredoxin n=1 Tax=Erythrolobus coxiae TaxID=362235 RepID=UPI001FCE2B82|nr:thioredoxin [Erythrolobus coxiae]UNJ17633.1 thioredoxin [Erythrolobus coxiae]